MEIYKPKNNTIDYININNPKSWIIDIYNDIKTDNKIEIDYFFYKNSNDIKSNCKNEILKHLYTEGIEKGLIYHPKQISNIIENINFTISNNLIYANNIILKKFIDNEIYSKSYDYFLNKLMEIDEIKNIYSNRLLIIIFIGNLEIGQKLVTKVTNYKNIQDFCLCLVYKRHIDITSIKNSISFQNVIYLKCYEFGNDIVPSLLAYDKIQNLANFKYVIKIHTKSANNWFSDLSNFLLGKSLNKLLSYENNKCNCISHPEYVIQNKGNQNTILIEKYRYLINKKYFVRGSMFLCSSLTFKKMLNFIKRDYKPYIFNNMYDTNCVNEKKSPIHFLERLFGMIR